MTNPVNNPEPDYNAPATKPKKKRRVIWWIVGFIVLIALVVGGLYGADRYAHTKATEKIDSMLTSSDSATFTGTVTQIDGFPFLTQVYDGALEHVKITADSANFHNEQGDFGVENVDIDMNNVSTAEPYTAKDIVITGRVPYAVIQERMKQEGYNVTVSGAEDGKLILAYEFNYFIVETTASLSVDESGRALNLRLEDLNLGHVTFDLGEVLPKVSTDIGIEQLPEGFTITELKPVAEGMDIKVEAHDMALSNLQGAN